MSNKQNLRKCIIAILIITVAMAAVIICVANHYMKEYNRKNNERMAAVLVAVHDKYPDISYNDMMEQLDAEYDNEQLSDKLSMLDSYGIDIEMDTLVDDNSSVRSRLIVLCAILLVAEALVLVVCFLIYDRGRDRDINDITRCIENINHKIYRMDIDSNTEDELSILKNEIYKTTLMLKEDAENSKLAKKLLKESLSDISHQLKTPLTSITIMLDNLYEEPDMDREVRQKFLRDMKREVSNINFMVQSLLKLSKLDANTVEFKYEDILLSDIVEESVRNVSALSDLKDVNINITSNGDYVVNCDKRWQIEAISNILKNSIEHSEAGGSVDIAMDSNHVYTSLSITNYGEQISEKDLPRLFERFYRGENATVDSVGIGLALAKSIVESCGGDITVDSGDGRTMFRIKYFK